MFVNENIVGSEQNSKFDKNKRYISTIKLCEVSLDDGNGIVDRVNMKKDEIEMIGEIEVDAVRKMDEVGMGLREGFIVERLERWE